MKYRVSLSAMALVSGSIEVEAEDEEAAEKKAREMTGDVLWEYQGIHNDRSVEVDYVDEVK